MSITFEGVPRKHIPLVMATDEFLQRKGTDGDDRTVGRVISEVFEDNTDIWRKDRYPFRVRIDFPLFSISQKGSLHFR